MVESLCHFNVTYSSTVQKTEHVFVDELEKSKLAPYFEGVL